MSKIRTSGFRHFWIMSGCKIVRISDNIWNPDINVQISNVRFHYKKEGEPDVFEPDVWNPDIYVRISNVRAIESTNQFRTGSKPVLVDSDDWNRFRTPERSKSGQYCPVIGRSGNWIDLKSGHLCPDFERSGNWRCLKAGHRWMDRTSDNRTCQNPDAFLSGSPNRTSGFRRVTVYS